MKRVLLFGALALGLGIGATRLVAQVVNMPPPAGVTLMGCANNTVIPTVVSGSGFLVQCDTNGNVKIAGSLSIAGTTSNGSDAVATSNTNNASVSYNYGFNGTTWDRLQVDGSKFLKVNCATGCAGGTFNNNADAVATSATNGQSAAWLYGFNGATWDRLRVDATKNLFVSVNAPLPTGSNVVGAVTQSGTWTVTGAGGTFPVTGATSNAGSAVATSATNVPAVAYTYAFNGTSWDQLQVDVTKNLLVHLNTPIPTGANTIGAVTQASGPWTQNITQFGSSNVVTGTGVGGAGIPRVTISNDSALAANQSVNVAQVGSTNTVNGGLAGTLAIGGTAATNQTITANPINLGAQAVSSENAANTTAKQAQLVADLVGKLIVMPYANKENFVRGTTSAMVGTTPNLLITAVPSNKIYLTHIMCTNSHATVGTFVAVQDGSGGSTMYEGYAAAVGGGFSATLPVPIATTAGNAPYVADVTTGANVICSASGYSGT